MVDDNYTHDVIRNKSDGDKVVFIKSIISQKGIPASFGGYQNSYVHKIFFRDDGEQRDWILYENNKFFCVYCLCFSLREKHRLIAGINYEKGCRISEILKLHETEAHHNRAKNIYAEKTTTCDSEERKKRLDKRIVLDTIVKIIIFQATHGMCVFFSFVD